MFSSADKATPPVHVARNEAVSETEGPFYRKAKTAEGPQNTFFGGNSFFPAQAKLEISQPEDPQEKEADAVAEQVMTMETVPPVSEEDDEGVQAKMEASQAETASPCPVQRAPVAATVQRQEGAGGFASNSVSEDDLGGQVQTKSDHFGAIARVEQRARGPPQTQRTATDEGFERSLASSKGAGTPMPRSVHKRMEGRFGADFAGVRIHTGSQAQSLSASIHAKAFTHGNDIYFNAGYYSPETGSGQRLLAHELTHTLQQGASLPAPAKADVQLSRAPVRPIRAIQREAQSIHRAEADSQRQAAVELARGEQGKVSANETGPDGKRMGWERLLEFFKTTFGEDKVLAEGAAYQRGAVGEGAIKQKSTFLGNAMAADGTTLLHDQERDVLPSWCGIFAFWALNKGGIPLKKWTLGTSMFPPDAAYPSGHQPQPGDIAWRREFQHFGLVSSSDGANVSTVNGNTSGDDNLGGQVQEQTHPIDHWFAFFDPASIQDGPLQAPGQGSGAAAPPVRSLAELRQSLFGVSPQHEDSGKQAQAPPKAPTAQMETVALEAEEETLEQEKEPEGEISAAPFALARAGAGDDPGQDGSGREAELPRQTDDTIQTHEYVSRELAPAVPAPALNTGRPADGSPSEERALPQARGPPAAVTKIHAKLQHQRVQRGWLGDAWDAVSGAVSEAAAWVEQGLDRAKGWLLGKVRDFVARIPGYDVLSLVLGEDPITGQRRPLTGHNLLEAGLDVLPLGSMFRTVLNRLGIFNDVATWLQGRIGAMRTLASGIVTRFGNFWDSLDITDVGDPDGVMDRVGSLLRGTITSIVDFVVDAATTFLDMVKEVMIREIAAFVRTRIPRLYPLLKVALGFDPETLEPVERNGTNILDAFLMVSEDGAEQRRQMIETGTYQRIVGWIDRGIHVFSTAWVELKAAIMGIWNFVTIESLFSPLQTLERIYTTFARPIGRVTSFMLDAAMEILRIIKDALMVRLAAFARETRGYTLLTVIIGSDPFTGKRVQRTVHNLVKGFMSLMDGGEQQYEQLKESGAIDRIVGKVTAAVERLNMTPEGIIALFIDLWNSFSIRDLARPIQTFTRIVRTFGTPIFRLVRFVIEILMIVVEAILILMGFPFDIIASIVANARQAWDLIKADVPAFFRNILAAVKQGFIQFFDNIGSHLLNGVVGWLMSELADAGLPILSDFSLQGVIGWVMQVLGISMEKIWEKLAEHPRIGPQRVAQIRGAIDTLTGIWTFIQDVRARGMAAIWDKIKEQLSNLWTTVIDAVKNWIMEKIIGTVVTKLLSMLDPTGIMAVINSAIAIYNAVQSFIKYLTEMLQVVNSFVRGIREIASGAIASAANFLEGAMGSAMPIVIGFLANQVGLGGVGQRVGEMIERVREMVDEAIGWLVNKAVDTGLSLLDRAMAAGRSARDAVLGWLGIRKTFRSTDGRSHSLYIRGSGRSARIIVESAPTPIEALLSQASSKLSAIPNATLQPHYDTAVTLNGEINALKARLAADNYPTAQARQSDFDALNQKMQSVSDVLIELMPLVDGPAPPEAVLPAFSAGVIGGGFEALYISSTTTGGQPASVNSGATMPGWRDLTTHTDPADPAKSIRERDNYVKMHLLHDQLGGQAADSNLAPTKSVYNTQFYNNCEQYAVRDKPTKVMWFKVTIDFHSAAGPVSGINYSPYPSSFTGEYGYMNYTNGQWAKGNREKRHSSSGIPVPDFAGGAREYEMNTSGATTIASMSHDGVNMPATYAALIALERTEAHDTGRHRKYRYFNDLRQRLIARHARRPASGHTIALQILAGLHAEGKLKFS